VQGDNCSATKEHQGQGTFGRQALPVIITVEVLCTGIAVTTKIREKDVLGRNYCACKYGQ
jgi:hypothetical protein